MIRTLFSVLVCAAFSTVPALGHEFWIDPEDFTVAPGEPIVAAIRVGTEYEGSSYSYLPKNFRLFEIARGAERTPVEGRMGDRPALSQAAAEEGLAVVLHVTSDNKITWRTFAEFEAFVTHKDADWVLAAHEARELPQEKFSEIYSRYAKSLVKVGAGLGADRDHGLLTEIIAGANPYTDDLSEGMPVTLTYAGAPRTDAQIEVFEKDEAGAVVISTVRTDAGGRAMVPVRPGHRYMLDAVVLREPEAALAAERDVVWESLWANLTFEVPRE